MAAAPHSPWTPAQRKKLCTLLRQRGLWEDRHAVCGVTSLADLSRVQAARLIDRLDPPAEPPRRRGRQPLQPGEVRAADDATWNQRETIIRLLQQLGWYAGPETLSKGIRGRFVIANLGSSHIDRDEASQLINVLHEALKKAKPPPRHQDTKQTGAGA